MLLGLARLTVMDRGRGGNRIRWGAGRPLHYPVLTEYHTTTHEVKNENMIQTGEAPLRDGDNVSEEEIMTPCTIYTS